MQIKQFEDKNLSHYSYAVLNEVENKIILIDPARNIQPYIDFAKEHNAVITGVIETHPHADFVSSHLELHKTFGAVIYVSALVNAAYPHTTFDEGDHIKVGNIKLSAINTPGHSPDSICVILEHEGEQKYVFTGDTLFIGDCGRPDLREENGNGATEKNVLATQMYHSLRNKIMPLNDEVIVYPTHGAGTLCGKALSKDSSSTIGKEKNTNWSLKDQTEEDFVEELLSDQPFVPGYFAYDVNLNKSGAPSLTDSLEKIKKDQYIDDVSAEKFNETLWIVDTRDEKEFKNSHPPHAVNLMEKGKFETWLGSIIRPDEKFYLAAESKEQLETMLVRTAAIGYESNIESAFICINGTENEEKLNVPQFRENQNDFTIIDVRNKSEVAEGKIFENSIPIPLADLRTSLNDIPTDKPIVVHCAGGYRSAAGSSIISSALKLAVPVFDLGDAVKDFQ